MEKNRFFNKTIIKIKNYQKKKKGGQLRKIIKINQKSTKNQTKIILKSFRNNNEVLRN